MNNVVKRRSRLFEPDMVAWPELDPVLLLIAVMLPLVGLVLKAITSEGLIDALTGSLVIDAMLVTLVSSLTTVVIIFIVGIFKVSNSFIINFFFFISPDQINIFYSIFFIRV